MDNLLVSVIVPAYNAERFIERCVGSILNQSYQNIELILVDDGSVDSTGSEIDLFATKDSRIRPIHKVNGGVSSARNKGLEVAIGDYIMFVDSDDWLEPEAIATMVEAAEENSLTICCSGYRSQYGDDCALGPKYANHSVNAPRFIRLSSHITASQMNEIFDLEPESYMFQCWGKLYDRKWLHNVRFNEDVSYGEDTVFVLDAISRPFASLGALPDVLYNYAETRTGLASSFKISKPSDIQWQHRRRLAFYRFNDLTEINQCELCRGFANDVIWAIEAVKQAPSEINDGLRLKYVKQLADSPYRQYYLRGLRKVAAGRVIKILYRLNIDLLWRWFISQ